MALTLCETATFHGVMAFRPSAPLMDDEGMVDLVTRIALQLNELPKAERTESKVADRLATAARALPEALQEVFLQRICDVLEKCNLIEPEPVAAAELPAEFLAKIQQTKAQWHQAIMRNPITRMMQTGCWTWANAVEAEDELFPERKAEREARAASAAAAAAAEEAAAAAALQEKQLRAERFIRDNKNPSLRPGNLCLGVTEAQLRSVFEKFGRISRINVPKCRDTGNTRGFAFVDFASPQEAARAYLALNEAPQMVGNQQMRVEFASTELRGPAKGGPAPNRRK